MSPPARVRPRAVPRGGVLGVCAPSGPVQAERLVTGLDGLRAIGFDVALAPGLLEREGFLAGTDAVRARDMAAFLRDPGIDGLVCARGGYGAMRILPLLDDESWAARAKPLVGFSDITALHQLLACQGVVSFHGTVLESPEGGQPAPNLATLASALTSLAPLGAMAWPADGPTPVCLYPGRASGPLVGGNLSLLAATMGTPWELRCEGCLLLLEDVGEPPYTIDRYLTQLALGGHLGAAAGFVVGELVDCGRPEDAPTAREVVAERLASLGKPCLANLPLGHGRYKLTVPLGVRAELDATAGSLTFVEPALA